MASKAAMGLAALIALTACEQSVAVTVSQSIDGSISLGIASRSSNFRACLDSARIYPADQQGRPLWEIGRTDPHPCVQNVSMETPPPGFSQRSSASLLPDRTYCAEVDGPGFSARRGFTMRHGALIQDRDDLPRC